MTSWVVNARLLLLRGGTYLCEKLLDVAEWLELVQYYQLLDMFSDEYDDKQTYRPALQ